ncbi:MAG: radical SAM protein [Spirochaetaceae bacterium]|nr:radical SAM protein [Spirochaetaceae bacterium]
MTKKADILLINPPFGPINGPSISIPVLAAYLKKKSINIEALDANLAVYKKLLLSDTIDNKKKYVFKRFLELNSKSVLSFIEINEYVLLYSVIIEANGFGSSLRQLENKKLTIERIQNLNIGEFLIKLFSLSSFPESIITGSFFNVYSQYSHSSSTDIIKSLDHSSIYTQFFDEIIQELFDSYNSAGDFPAIIGFSIIFANQVIPAFQMAHRIKKIAPGIHITFGGASISIYMRDLKTKDFFKYVDSFILDEGEIPLEFLAAELEKEKPDFAKVPGLIYLENDIIHQNAPAGVIPLEESPTMEYEVFPLNEYIFQKDKLLFSFRLSKGCIWKKCAFCRTDSYFVNCIKIPSPGFIYSQLKEMLIKTNAKKVFFTDQSADPLVLEYIAGKLIEDKFDIEWSAHTRIDKNLTKERCLLYKESGCSTIMLGVESVNNRILTLIKKGITEKLIDEVLKQIDSSIPILLYMISGFPTETEQESLDSYNKIKKYLHDGLIQNFYYSVFTLNYGADIWNHPGKYGITSINIPESDDLNPDVLYYDGAGMTRAQVFKMNYQFMEEYYMNKHGDSLNEKDIKIQSLIYGLNEKLNYNIDELRSIIFTQNSKLDLPVIKCFEQCDISVKSLTKTRELLDLMSNLKV